jgi:hypothetical protein
LALRTKNPSAKVAKRLEGDFTKAPIHTQQLIKRNYEKLRNVYEADSRGSYEGKLARSYALRILELTRPYISASRYAKLKGELREQKSERAHRLAYAGAFAKILRDTGRMLNSISPQINSADRVLRAAPGAVSAGSNVSYFKYHQSSAPRKKKADGSDKLPRRQILPDEDKPIPAAWWIDIRGTLAHGLEHPNFWLRLLGAKARPA